MKLKSSVFSQILQNVSTASIIAVGASWLFLAAAVEYFDQDNNTEIECSVSVHNNSTTSHSTKCISVNSAKHSVFSSRRLEALIQTPFVLHAIQNRSVISNINTGFSVFSQVTADPANHVRAGPEK